MDLESSTTVCYFQWFLAFFCKHVFLGSSFFQHVLVKRSKSSKPTNQLSSSAKTLSKCLDRQMRLFDPLSVTAVLHGHLNSGIKETSPTISHLQRLVNGGNISNLQWNLGGSKCSLRLVLYLFGFLSLKSFHNAAMATFSNLTGSQRIHQTSPAPMLKNHANHSRWLSAQKA